MSKSYTKNCSRILLLAVAMLMVFSVVATSQNQKGDTTYLHLTRLNRKDKNLLKTFHVQLPAIKTYSITPPITKTAVTASVDDRTLSSVQVYPNPVTDQINVKYVLSRPSNVDINIMDVLGNKVISLVSQHVEAGEFKVTQNLKGKLNSGFYFVRVVVGTESVIKRISIL